MTFGAHLTKMAYIPKGSKLCTVEEFPSKSIFLRVFIIVLVATICTGGYLYYSGFFCKKDKCNESSKTEQVSNKSTQGQQTTVTKDTPTKK